MNAYGKKIETEDLTLLPMPQQITLADGWFNNAKRELSPRREPYGTKTIYDTPEERLEQGIMELPFAYNSVRLAK